MSEDKAVKTGPADKAVKKSESKPLVDSEGLRVSSVTQEESTEEKPNTAARKAAEAEAKAIAEDEAKKREEFEKFLAERAK